MKIEVLGCSGAVSRGYNTTSFLIDDRILIDAGSVASTLSEEAIFRIRHILLTHSHIDHIKELPFIMDVLFGNDKKGLNIWGSAATLEVLTKHVFNNRVWPKMDQYNKSDDFFRFNIIDQEELQVDDYRIKAIPVPHIPGSVSYLIEHGGKKVIFSGDTSDYQPFFDRVMAEADGLDAFFVEASFPNRMSEVARITRHLTAGMVAQGVSGLVKGSSRVIIYHMKPRYIAEILAELPDGIEHIKGGEVLHFD